MTSALPSAGHGHPAAAMLEKLLSGPALSAKMRHSPQGLEAIYHIAFNLYGQAKYPEAMRIFAYLLTCNHLDRRFHSGFAACLHMQRQHRDAIRYYHQASMLDMTDPEPPMRMAECRLALGEHDEARTAINWGLTQARGVPAHAAYVARFEAMLALLDAASKAPATSSN